MAANHGNAQLLMLKVMLHCATRAVILLGEFALRGIPHFCWVHTGVDERHSGI